MVGIHRVSRQIVIAEVGLHMCQLQRGYMPRGERRRCIVVVTIDHRIVRIGPRIVRIVHRSMEIAHRSMEVAHRSTTIVTAVASTVTHAPEWSATSAHIH